MADLLKLAERLKDAAAQASKGYFDPRTYAADILKAATAIQRNEECRCEHDPLCPLNTLQDQQP